MTALIAVERCDLKETVTVPEKAVGVEGSSVYLYRDEKLTVEELVLAMMLESANDAATAIAIGIARVCRGFCRADEQESGGAGAFPHVV